MHGEEVLPALPPEPMHGSLTAAMTAVAVRRANVLKYMVVEDNDRERLGVSTSQHGLEAVTLELYTPHRGSTRACMPISTLAEAARLDSGHWAPVYKTQAPPAMSDGSRGGNASPRPRNYR